MNNKLLKYIFAPAALAIFIMGCANRGIGPQGGPKDETPPKVVKETPENGALNYTEKKVEVLFNEYIQLDNVSKNVLISPPQQRPPEVKAYGKKLTVTFDEDMQDSTTYTIDFGAAICDNNEKNPLEGYSFAFSTGDIIDSLQISGILLNAEDLNPVEGIMVGIHSNTHDSALYTIPFKRINKTNSQGKFKIKNIKAGDYRIFALNDVSSDYTYQAGEALAFNDSIYTPICTTETINDTVWTDSVTIDTIKTKTQLKYSPKDIVLFYFSENKQKLYLQRTVREQPHYFKLFFSAKQDSLPIIKPIGDFNWLQHTLCQPNLTNDTITYWLTDSAVIKLDTLNFQITYYKTDSLYQLQQEIDTLNAIYRAPKLSEYAKRQQQLHKKQPQVEFRSNGKSPFEIYKALSIQTSTPIAHFNIDSIHLSQVIDTLHKNISFRLQQVDSTKMNFKIDHDWGAENTFQLEIDSAAFVDIYGNVNQKFKTTFKTRSLDEYSALVIKVEPFQDNIMIQLLDEKDNPIKTLPAKTEGTKFEYLSPKSYYVRLFIDYNTDQLWTTGDYKLHRQPEPVYYFPSKLTLRANWDFEETFKYLEQPILKQKPKELVKTANSKKK